MASRTSHSSHRDGAALIISFVNNTLPMKVVCIGKPLLVYLITSACHMDYVWHKLIP